MAALDKKKKLLSDGTQSPSVQASAPSVQSASPATNLAGVSENTLGNLGKYSQGYKPSEAVSNAQSYLTGILNSKPGAYNSAYQSDLQGLYDRIMNREKFTYDLNGDALYNQYKQQYQQMGRQAMMDTMGQAAALTGGYGNSYANTAGNQAYQAYLSKVGDIVPQLQQQAFERYTQEGSDLNNRLNLVQNLENADYNRYRDSVSDWNTERSYANDDYWNQRNQDYQDYMNMLNYWNQQAQQENQNYWSQQQYDTSVSQYERDLAYKQAMAILSGGKLPSADLLAKAGISDADALNRYMQQANDYFNSTYTDRNAGMKLRNSGLMSGVQKANAAGQKVQQYFSSNPQIYSNGKYAEEKANYDRVSSEVADPALDYRLRARTGDMSVLDEEMDDDTREAVKRNFRQWQYENFYNTSKRETLKNGNVGGTQGLSIWDNVTALRAQALPEVFGYNSDQKSTRALAKGAKNYSELTDMLRAYSRDQLEDDTTIVRTRLGSAQEQRDAAARLNMLVGDGYAQRLQRDWLTDPSVLAEAFDVYEGLQKDSSDSYVDALKKAGIYYDGTAEDVNSSYEDYVSTLNAQESYLKEQSTLDTLYKQLDKKFGERIQQAKSRASNPLLSMSRASNQQQGVYTMIAEGYDAAKKAGYIDKAPVSQGIDTISKEYYDGGYDRMTDEEKDNFIALYNDPTQGPGVAFEYLNELKYFTQKKDSDEQEIWISNLAQDGFLGAAAATGISFAAGLANDASSLYVMTDRLINGDQDGKYNEYSPELRYSMIHDVAQGTVAQVIEEAAPNLELAGINIPKAAYNAATSAIESAMRTALVGHASIFTMGIGAAGSSYRNNLAKVGSVSGYTEDDAYVDSLFDGAVESLTEIFSVEQLLNPTLSPLKNAVRAPLTEMSEEVLGDLVDMGYDTIKYKSRSELSQRYYELLTQGYTNEEAKTMVTQEVAREIAETALVAAISGEMMGGPQAIAAQIENSRVGSEVRKNDNVTGLLDLADTLELPEDVQRMSAEQRSAAEKGEKVSSAKLGRILRESMAKLDESGQKILSESAEKLAKNVLLENGYDGDDVNLNALAEKVVRLVSGQGVTELEMKDVARSDAATRAVQALTERTTELKKIGDKFGKLDSLMKPREAAQTEISDRLREVSAPQEVTEAFDEAVAKADEAVAKATEEAESDALSAEDERAVRLESFASEYGKNADVMQNAINDGQDVDAYARAFKVAEVRGEDGQSFDVVKKLSVLSDLTENQVRIAYELGRGIRGARSAQLRQNTNYSGTQVQVGNVDTSAIKGHLTGAQQRSIDAARSVAQALGVNIRFFESAANELGQYTAENGSFDGDTMTISLDIHAGSNSKFST